MTNEDDLYQNVRNVLRNLPHEEWMVIMKFFLDDLSADLFQEFILDRAMSADAESRIDELRKIMESLSLQIVPV
jgi:hypothetical protein